MPDTEFWQTLSDSIHRAINLRIVTMVGDAVVGGTLESLKVSAPATSAGSLVTDINLVGGDITCIVSDKLNGPDYAALRSAHDAAVKQAQEIVERNVRILVSVAKELGEQLNLLPPPRQGPDRGG